MRCLKLALLGLAAAGLIAAPGCGEDSEDDQYASEVQAVLEPLDSELREIGDTVTGSRSIEDVAAAVNSFEEEIAETVQELESIEPPEGAERGHELLVEAFATFNRAVMGLSEAAESGSATAVVSTAEQLQTAAARLQSQLSEAEQQLRDAGVDVGD